MFVYFLSCLLARSLVVRLFLDVANISSWNNKCSLVRFFVHFFVRLFLDVV